MAVSDALELLQLSENQTEKAAAINIALGQMEALISASINIASTLAASDGATVNIPFDDANDLSPREALRFLFLYVDTGGSHPFDLIHPPNPHLFFMKNNCDYDVTVKTATGTSVIVEPSETACLYCDGTDMVNVTAAFTVSSVKCAEDFRFHYYGHPEASSVLGRFLIGRETIFPANLVGSQAQSANNPAVETTLSLWGSIGNFASIVFATDGSVSFTTSGGTARTLPAGTVLEVRSGGTVAGNFEDIDMTILATVNVSQT